MQILPQKFKIPTVMSHSLVISDNYADFIQLSSRFENKDKLIMLLFIDSDCAWSKRYLLNYQILINGNEWNRNIVFCTCENKINQLSNEDSLFKFFEILDTPATLFFVNNNAANVKVDGGGEWHSNQTQKIIDYYTESFTLNSKLSNCLN